MSPSIEKGIANIQIDSTRRSETNGTIEDTSTKSLDSKRRVYLGMTGLKKKNELASIRTKNMCSVRGGTPNDDMPPPSNYGTTRGSPAQKQCRPYEEMESETDESAALRTKIICSVEGGTPNGNDFVSLDFSY